MRTPDSPSNCGLSGARRVVGASCTIALVAMVGLIAPAPPAWPAVVQRCTTQDGGIAYTDGACAAIGGRPAPMRVELLGRLASEARVEGGDIFDVHGGISSLVPVPGAAARRSPSAGCARTPRQLAADLRGSFALADVNRLAESYHWAGMSNREGQRTMDRLDRLMSGHAVVDSRYYAAQIASLGDAGWADAPARGGDAGILQVVFVGDGVQKAIEFDVHRYQDCYFVSF